MLRDYGNFTRRQWLRAAGFGGLGLALPRLFQAQAVAAAPADAGLSPIRSCIFIFLYGGPSHLDTWDMKPAAPREVRGEFQAIATSVPGLVLCEHLPRMAQVMHKVAVVRTMYHGMRNHDSACTHTFTGRIPLRGDVENFTSPSEPTSMPGFGAALSYVRRDRPAVLPHAAAPFLIRNLFPPLGQTAGFLGSAYDPFLIEGDSKTQTYRADKLLLPDGLSKSRLESRSSLLQEMDRHVGTAPAMRESYEKAFRLLASAAVHRALDVSQEPLRVRERYGLAWPGLTYPIDNITPELAPALPLRGQNLLLARRLVEAGVPFVNVYDFRVQGANWDTHTQNFERLKGYLLPPADQALSALIEDLDERGLLDTTLVVALGEFGRTPKITEKTVGREHWPDCYSAILAGGGIRGGTIYGASEKLGAYPASDPVTPADLAATIYWRFGVDPETEIHDGAGRPYRLSEGEPVRALFG
ncbi:MAG: DUF1501 domain-containing protein [Planctomycetia bacterium]|nr:DUF1501 domain-containing protein [Planctomycetia bacterium]